MASHSSEKVRFKEATIRQLLELNKEKRAIDKTVKFSFDGAKLLAHLARHFVDEAVCRAVAQAESEGQTEVDVDHLRKVLPQLMLDFT
uniref:Centromere protein X n=1 Tax=Plectus sambesii TaxID=2011161 RepID=A0A914W9N3_9BILA